MPTMSKLRAFGPVPSRRFGRSLGINNTPYKMCTYSCVYCQLGHRTFTKDRRCTCYDPLEISAAVGRQLLEVELRGESVDFITFVPEGEPTLDRNIGEEIRRVKSFGHKVAVITNGSLLWKKDVRDDLQMADWVSIKVDSVQSLTWRELNRPNTSLGLREILDGLLEFSSTYRGLLSTETMLIADYNDSPEELDSTAGFIAQLYPYKSYITLPTWPTAEKWVQPASAYKLAVAYSIFRKHSINTEYLVGYEGNRFASTGESEEDILSITSVHPMRKDAMQNYLKENNLDWSTVETLLADENLLETKYNGRIFYVRDFHQHIPG